MSKPDFSLTTRPKRQETPAITREYESRDGEIRTAAAEVMLGYENTTKDGTRTFIAWVLAKGWTLHGPRGEVVSSEDYYINQRDHRIAKAEARASAEVDWKRRNPVEDDGIPF